MPPVQLAHEREQPPRARRSRGGIGERLGVAVQRVPRARPGARGGRSGIPRWRDRRSTFPSSRRLPESRSDRWRRPRGPAVAPRPPKRRRRPARPGTAAWPGRTRRRARGPPPPSRTGPARAAEARFHSRRRATAWRWRLRRAGPRERRPWPAALEVHSRTCCAESVLGWRIPLVLIPARSSRSGPPEQRHGKMPLFRPRRKRQGRDESVATVVGGIFRARLSACSLSRARLFRSQPRSPLRPVSIAEPATRRGSLGRLSTGRPPPWATSPWPRPPSICSTSTPIPALATSPRPRSRSSGRSGRW